MDQWQGFFITIFYIHGSFIGRDVFYPNSCDSFGWSCDQNFTWCAMHSIYKDFFCCFHFPLVALKHKKVTKNHTNYLFCAVFTIVSISSIISDCLFLSSDLTASIKQHHKWSWRSCTFTDFNNHITARFCWITLIQYWSFSTIEMIFSKELFAFLREITIFSFCGFICIYHTKINTPTIGVGLV